MQAEIGVMKSDRYNKTGVNGMLVFEPMITTFDKIQSIPLKLVMSVISEMRPDLTWKKTGHTTQCSSGHTWGSGDIPRLVCFRPPAWEMHRLCQRKGCLTEGFPTGAHSSRGFPDVSERLGKNRSKTLATVGNVTRDDALNPEGSFMEQIWTCKR